MDNFAPENARVDGEKKELDNLVHALGENKLFLRKPCMEGTHTTILQEIENGIESIDGHNVIWIRGSPGKPVIRISTAVESPSPSVNTHYICYYNRLLGK